MRHLRKSSILVVLLIGATLLGVAPATAGITIGVSPAILEVDATAGGHGHIDITISNRGDEPFEVLTAVESYLGMVDEHSAEDWLTIRPKRLPLEPDESRSAELSIDIPEGIGSGGRYASLTFTTVPPDTDDTTTALAGQIVVPVLMAVDGTGPLVRLPSLQRTALFLETDGRLGIRAEVHNDGNVHVPLAGSAEFSSPSGTEAALEISMGRALPGRTRAYTGQGTLPLPLERPYDVTLRLASPPGDDAQAPPAIDHAFSLEATAELAVDGLAICENLDRGPSISAELSNVGTVGVVPTIQFRVLDEAGSPVGTTGPSGSPDIWPQERMPLAAEVSQRLVSGSYTLVVTTRFGLDSSVEASLPFSIGGDPATAAPLCTPLATESTSTD